jgi:hypothetical protein
MIRNRIKGHRKVRAGDLVPHEMNPRTHTDTQRQALHDILNRIGFARSVLAYEVDCETCHKTGHWYTSGKTEAELCPSCNGEGKRLKLIDGHLRQSMDANQEIEVEVLDVNDAEARELLLTIDPLAQLAGYDAEITDKLRQTVNSDSPTLNALWDAVRNNQAASEATLKKSRERQRQERPEGQEQYLVLIECQDERHQVEVLRRLKREGLVCQAKTS